MQYPNPQITNPNPQITNPNPTIDSNPKSYSKIASPNLFPSSEFCNSDFRGSEDR